MIGYGCMNAIEARKKCVFLTFFCMKKTFLCLSYENSSHSFFWMKMCGRKTWCIF
jgi:hypothetical protein